MNELAIAALMKGVALTNVVFCLIISIGKKSKSFAKHSSAKEFDTVSTPVKSKTIGVSVILIADMISSRTFAPCDLVPKCKPKFLNSKIIVLFFNEVKVAKV